MVRDVQVRGGYVLHVGTVEGTLAVGDTVTLTIDGVCTVTIQILYTVVAVTECVQLIMSASSFVWLQSFSFMEFTKAPKYLNNRTCYDEIISTILFSSRWRVY